jgi:hypothetical protein
MRAAGYLWAEIAKEVGELVGPQLFDDWNDAVDSLGANSNEHAIALAIRGGHIL